MSGFNGMGAKAPGQPPMGAPAPGAPAAGAPPKGFSVFGKMREKMAGQNYPPQAPMAGQMGTHRRWGL